MLKHSKYIYCATDQALWSPNTCVVDPKAVLKRLCKRVEEMGVEIIYDSKIKNINTRERTLKIFSLGILKKINYGHLFNCAGVHADEVSRKFELSENYKILPFKGIYWKLNSNIKFNFKTNIYPVPDLNLPFLGVHITPNTKGEVFLGPTAIPAFGKENYNGFEGFEPIATTKFLGNLAFQWLINSNGFRRYANQQACQGIKPIFFKICASSCS